MGELEWDIETHEVIDSTSTRAMDRVREAFEKGIAINRAVVVAERQRAGRGQHGRVWESPVGGLYFSAILEGVAVSLRGMMPLLAGVAIIDGLWACGFKDAMLRWPNDVLLKDRKVAGVLCESVAQG